MSQFSASVLGGWTSFFFIPAKYFFCHPAFALSNFFFFFSDLKFLADTTAFLQSWLGRRYPDPAGLDLVRLTWNVIVT